MPKREPKTPVISILRDASMEVHVLEGRVIKYLDDGRPQDLHDTARVKEAMELVRQRMPKLTELQRNVLCHIIEHTRLHGYQPSYIEISEHFGWSSPYAAGSHIYGAWTKGYCTPVGNRAIAIYRELL